MQIAPSMGMLPLHGHVAPPKLPEFLHTPMGPFVPPPPPCNSYALVIATVGVGTVLIWYLILIRCKCSAAA